MANWWDKDPIAQPAQAPSNWWDNDPVQQIQGAQPANPVEPGGQRSSGYDMLETGVGGFLEGLPVVGPFIRSGVEKAAAATDAAFTDRTYADNLKFIEEDKKRLKEQNPVTDTVSQIAGGMAGMAPVVAAAPAAFGAGSGSLLSNVAAGGVSGAAVGGADAWARGQDPKTGALVGGAFGAAAPVVAKGVGAIADKVMQGRANSQAIKTAPSVDELKGMAQGAYKEAEEAGLQISGDAFARKVQEIALKAQREGLDPTLHPQATAALRRLGDTIGTEPTLQDLDILRRVVGSAANTFDNPDNARIASQMRDSLDDLLEGLQPKDVLAGDALKGSMALKKARDLWGRARKTEVIEQMFERAKTSAPNFSGSGYENALRTEFRGLAKNLKRLKQFSPAERQAIMKVARGGPIENVLRQLGKFAPTGVVSTALSGGLGFGVGGGLGAVALPTAGALARQAATQMTGRNAELASALARRGRDGLPAAQMSAEAMRRLLTGGQAAGVGLAAGVRKELAP